MDTEWKEERCRDCGEKEYGENVATRLVKIAERSYPDEYQHTDTRFCIRSIVSRLRDVGGAFRGE